MRSSLRPPLADLGLAALLVVFTLLGTRGAAQGDDAPRTLDALGYGLAGLAAASLAARRVAPLLTVTVSGAAVTLYLGAGYSFGPALAAAGLAMLSAAWRLPVTRSLPACLAVLAAVTVGHLARLAQEPDSNALGLAIGGTGWLLAPWAIGTLLRARSEAAARERREDAERAVTGERLRIAGEVHDVAGHGLAVIAMQAGVALHVLERRPEQARIALEEIRAASTEALDGLRATLAGLREPNAETPLAPGPPGLAEVPALVERIRRAGLAVELTETGGPTEPPPGEVGQVAYRIVQEALTNVLRHAGATGADVALDWTDGFLRVRVRDDGSAVPGPEGTGIAGMRARAERLGGLVSAGRADGGGFEVSAALPYRSGNGYFRVEAPA